MHPSDQKNTDKLIELVNERDEMAEFERRFRDRERGNVLREGVTLNAVFEKAGYKPMKWEELSLTMHSWIQNGFRRGYYGITARPWEKEQMIFGKPHEGTYYLVQKSGKNFSWSRLWVEGETPRIEPMNHDSSLAEVIGTVAYHEFGEKPESKTEAVEETRTKAKKNLRPWEKK